ncbi:signal peptidase I [Sinomicrobium weinanense]|uniref:Signal peptidase I n=1 Tax=Sinomicrobium weinanense TaxID=2842200 RepID=A0A926Q564_9FLAO|nr:signal peptidase I [Sinomicrobium weinanense]MBC9797816.1 signal peptidase I [Sinomicrobium weinanense]MBU3125965.1 signal peptidase I [Sinomicrobium weinanense]
MKDSLNHMPKYFSQSWRFWLLFLGVVFPLFFGLIWLTLLQLLLFGVYKCMLYVTGWIKNMTLRKLIRGIFLFLWLLLISVCAKVFLVEIYKIPSNSMENTLFSNDVILVNKLTYGPKLPRSPFEISWVNLLFYLNDNARNAMEENWWSYRRLDGIRNVKQGDVLVFQESRTLFVIKRCVGVAGDTLSIIAGKVYTNSEKYFPPSTVKKKYNFKVTNRRKFFKRKDSIIPNVYFSAGDDAINSFQGNFTYDEWERISKIPEVYDLKKELDTYDAQKGLFAMPRGSKWTLDNMGPFLIPKKGLEIKLDAFNFHIYKKALEKYEKVEIHERNGGYFINGEKAKSYRFKQDYFFVMGDNREGSLDSRYIGFIPEEHIVGKVPYILFSYYRRQFRWNRFFKKLL